MHYGSADDTPDRSVSSLDHTVTMFDGIGHLDTTAAALGKEVKAGEGLNPNRAYVSEADIGMLQGVDSCMFPPPSSSSSGLSEGEVAGVAVGATIGGIVLILIAALILRKMLFKNAKPVFPCLEKGNAETKQTTETKAAAPVV